MALTQRLLIRQSQALVMTPQLMQAIKLLQLSNLDLVAYVEGELERNPLLDQERGRRTGGGSQRDPWREAAGMAMGRRRKRGAATARGRAPRGRERRQFVFRRS